jgi:putative PEP-CTERM system histidine kinase
VIVQSAVHLKQIVNLDHSEGKPVGSLAEIHPRVFPHGGARLAVPLTVGDANLGVIIVGDRVDGVPFTSEDRDLLTTVAEQAALELQAIRLSSQLIQAREMEAFQNMSTFFVHDLKNTASSLSLMLQNLPRHFDNPEFRADALKSIGKSVARINQMIQSLSALRRQLVIDPARVDLAKALAPSAGTLANDRNIRLKCDFQPTGFVNVDAEQIDRVLTNLIVNAHEASAPDAPIRLSTGRQDGFAFFEIADRGEGMTADYIQRHLFRPFQTTKKQGTGIGLYHSKMIVDAHGGRVEVQSQPGAGTTFRILLPSIPSSDETDRPDH